MNMTMINAQAWGVEEAINASSFEIKKNLTKEWKKAGKPTGEKELTEFAEKYRDEKLDGVGGLGCIIEVTKAVKDNRLNTCKVKNVVTKKARKFARVYNIMGLDGKDVVGSAKSKKEAVKLAKQYVSDNRDTLPIDCELVCKVGMELIEGDPIAFKFENTISTKAKIGEYTTFIIPNKVVDECDDTDIKTEESYYGVCDTSSDVDSCCDPSNCDNDKCCCEDKDAESIDDFKLTEDDAVEE